MKLIKPYYQILTPINGEEILKQIELAARTCYQSEEKIEYEDADIVIANAQHGSTRVEDYKAKSARVLIKKLIANEHEAMLEFGGMITVRFVVDRGVTHELVRHRVASFAQESTRYCNYKDKDIEFIIPNWINDINVDICNDRSAACWYDAMQRAEHDYQYLITGGGGEAEVWTPQQARSILPNSLKSEINISANIREWRHIFKLRTAKTAHPQMREVMCPLLDEFKSKIPILFDDINY